MTLKGRSSMDAKARIAREPYASEPNICERLRPFLAEWQLKGVRRLPSVARPSWSGATGLGGAACWANILVYADDLVILANPGEHMQQTQDLCAACAMRGLGFRGDKFYLLSSIAERTVCGGGGGGGCAWFPRPAWSCLEPCCARTWGAPLAVLAAGGHLCPRSFIMRCLECERVGCQDGGRFLGLHDTTCGS